MTTKEYQHQYYLKHKELVYTRGRLWANKYREQLLKSRKKHRNAQVKYIISAKNRPCADCQGWFNYWQMDFDHRENSGKLYNIGSMKGLGNKRLIEEMAKCDVVCANCHRDRTQKRKQWISSLTTAVVI